MACVFDMVRSTLLRPGWWFSPSVHFGHIPPRGLHFDNVFRFLIDTNDPAWQKAVAHELNHAMTHWILPLLPFQGHRAPEHPGAGGFFRFHDKAPGSHPRTPGCTRMIPHDPLIPARHFYKTQEWYFQRFWKIKNSSSSARKSPPTTRNLSDRHAPKTP